jgi:hypothetical protein
MYLGEVGWGDVEWIGLAQDRYKWRALDELSGCMKVWNVLELQHNW